MNYLLAAVFAFMMCATMSVEARSITSVQRRSEQGAKFLDVTFEAGEPGDEHALYVAYDMEDKGDSIGNWTALQRGCNVAADATSATIPVSPLLTDEGYTFCRVFLTTSAAPYDTQLEYLRQSGTQYIDTGIYPDSTSVAVMDTKLDSNATRQQRFFGVSSDKAAVLFNFDVYVNGSGYFASACNDNAGSFNQAVKSFSTDRVLISLSAAEKHHIVITNLTTGAQICNASHNTTCTKTSAATLLVFAQHLVANDGTASVPAEKIATGANLYSFTMTKNAECVCDYKPCKLGNRVGVYDSVTDTIVYSASGTDFDAANSGSAVACSLLTGETQLSAAPAATELLSDFTWNGTSPNWDDTNAWTKDGDPATWAEGNNAIFSTANATATLAADVTARKLVFSEDAIVNGSATLTVSTVSVDSGVSATISAPTAGALEKTGAGTLTLTENRADATTVTEGALKMNGATVTDLTLGTDGGAPVTFDYGGQELVKNTGNYLVTGSTVTLTNGIFSTASGDDLNIRDDTFTMPSVLTIAKDAVVRQGAAGKSIYINNTCVEATTINVVGGTLGNTNGCSSVFIQHKSPDSRLNINVTEGGLVYLPCTVNALCGNNTVRTTPSLCMTFSDSAFRAGTFNFGNIYSSDNYAPTAPTAVFAATNSVVSVDNNFFVGRNKQDSKTEGSYTVDFEGCTITAKTFTVYYDRPLNNARFNNTRFVFNAESGSIVANDGEANWFTVGADGLTIDTQAYSATLNANLGGSGAVTKVGAETLTVSRDQATTGGFNIAEGTLTINGSKTFAGPVEFAAGSTMNIAGYDGTTSVSANTLTLPAEGTVALTLNGGAFAKGVYAICSAAGVTAADGAKFAPSTGDLDFSWSVADDTLLLTVGEVSGNYWTGRGGDGKMSTAANWLNGVPAAGADIDLSVISSATTIIADAERTFGAVTMGDAVITFTSNLTATAFSDMSKISVAADSTVTIDNDITITAAAQRLCNNIAAGGKLRITGVLEVAQPSGNFQFSSSAAAGAVVVEGGIVMNTGSTSSGVLMNVKSLALGENGIAFTNNSPFRLNNKPTVYALGERTVLGTNGRGLFRGNSKPFTFCTTQFESDQPAIMLLDAHVTGVTDYWAQWAVTGCGRFETTAATGTNRGWEIDSGATFSLNPDFDTSDGTSGQDYIVSSNATLEVAASGTLGINGKTLTLADGVALGFNFTEPRTAPVLALGSKYTPTLTVGGAVTVKVSGVRPRGGEHQLTTCGGFGAEGVTVALAEGAPKWVIGLSVNGDGNIVLSVKPKPMVIIVR